MSKKKNDRLGIVYSTDPEFSYQYRDEEPPEAVTPAQQRLRVSLDRKQRKGKEVTLITGFVGAEDDLKNLEKFLKTKCGTGGSAKDGEILIQGDHRDKIMELLKEQGYVQTKRSGG